MALFSTHKAFNLFPEKSGESYGVNLMLHIFASSQYFNLLLQNFIFFCNTSVFLRIYVALFWLHSKLSFFSFFDKRNHEFNQSLLDANTKNKYKWNQMKQIFFLLTYKSQSISREEEYSGRAQQNCLPHWSVKLFPHLSHDMHIGMFDLKRRCAEW